MATAPANTQTSREKVELDRDFREAPTNGLHSDILVREYGETILFERHNSRGSGAFYQRAGDTWAEFFGILGIARKVGEDAVNRAHAAAISDRDKEIDEIFKVTGKALARCRTTDFLAKSVRLFAERVTRVDLPWNSTAECLPLLDGILDYTGAKAYLRHARPDEFFRDPLPYHGADVFNSGVPDRWLAELEAVYPDPEDRQMARQCLSLAVRNAPTKTFQVWFSREGHGGKNTIVDCLSAVLPGRIRPIAGSVILRGGDASERRFGAGELEGATMAVFDEVG